MPDLKISQLPAGIPTDDDLIPFVDLDGSPVTKKATRADLKGDQGEAATVDVGTTTTLAPGVDATVVNSGTVNDAILDFGIPQGEQGIQGPQGPQGPGGSGSGDFKADGTVPMTGNLDLGTKEIVNGSKITLTDDINIQGLDLYNYTGLQATTGMVENGGPEIDTDTTKFKILAGEGIIVDNFTDIENVVVTRISWNDITAITPIYNAEFASYVGIENTGTPAVPVISVIQQATPFTNEQRRSIVAQGVIFSSDGGVNVTLTTKQSDTVVGVGYLAADRDRAIGLINEVGNDFTNTGTSLQIKKQAGVSSQSDINPGVPKNRNTLTSGVISIVNYIRVYQDGVGGFTQVPGTSAIIPGFYDDGSGVLQAITANKWTNQRVWFLPRLNLVVISAGQTVYNSKLEAQQGITTEVFVRAPELVDANLRTTISVRGAAINLSLPGDVVFTNTGKFGFGSTGGSGATGIQDLQDTYNLSTNPEITTDATRGALTLKQGSGADTDNILEGRNGAGTNTFSVDGNGNIIANSITAPIAINTQTGTTYTLALTDQNKSVLANNAGSQAYTIPTNASVAFPTGTTLIVTMYGAGVVTITGDTGVTVNGVSGGGVVTVDQYDTLALEKIGADEWLILGGASGGGGVSEIFDTYMSGNYNLSTSETTLPFNTENIDTGSNFDITTFKYTAPSDGDYEFTTTLKYQSVTAADNLNVRIYKNAGIEKQIGELAASTHGMINGNFKLPLLSGDTVHLTATNFTATRGLIGGFASGAIFNGNKLN